MFTVHLKPHHVQYSDGLWDERGEPEREHPHHVEIDLSTGMVGYTRLSPTEVKEQKAEAEKYHKAALELEKVREKRLAAIKGKAREDPAFRALAEHLGIPLD